MAIRVTIHATGTGACALTGKECDGLTVAFESEAACFLSWKAFRQLVMFRTAQQPRAEPKTAQVAAAVTPGNGK